MKVIIAGSRSLATAENGKFYLFSKMDKILQNVTENIVIISGMARGADLYGLEYAEVHNFSCIKKPANWDKYGKSAGYIRNESMAKCATHCVVFWDGKSKGSKHMIDLAKKYNLEFRVIYYKLDYYKFDGTKLRVVDAY